MNLISNQQLQTLTETIARQVFHHAFTHRIIFNARLKTTGGRYFKGSHNIDINPKMVTNFNNLEVLTGVIKHELCHYFLDLAPNKNPNHRSSDFKTLLHQVGGLRYAPKLTKAKYQYVCQRCHHHYYRQRRVNTNQYVCGKCQGKLQLVHSKGR